MIELIIGNALGALVAGLINSITVIALVALCTWVAKRIWKGNTPKTKEE